MLAVSTLILVLYASPICGLNILNHKKIPATTGGIFSKSGMPAEFFLQHVDGSIDKVRLETDDGKMVVTGPQNRVRMVEAPEEESESGRGEGGRRPSKGAVFVVARVSDEHSLIIHGGKCVLSQGREMRLGDCSRSNALMYITNEGSKDSGSSEARKDEEPAKPDKKDSDKLSKLLRDYVAMARGKNASGRQAGGGKNTRGSGDSESSEDSSSDVAVQNNPAMLSSGYPAQQPLLLPMQFQQPVPNQQQGGAYASNGPAPRRSRHKQHPGAWALQQAVNPLMPVANLRQPLSAYAMGLQQQGMPAMNPQQQNVLPAQLGQRSSSPVDASNAEASLPGNEITGAIERKILDKQVENFIKDVIKKDKSQKKNKRKHSVSSDDADDDKENAPSKRKSKLDKLASSGVGALMGATPAGRAANTITSLFG